MQTRMFINGQLEAGQGELFTVFNPATGAELVRIPEASPAQVAAAVAAADAALARLGAHRAEGSRGRPAEDRRPGRGECGGTGAAGVGQLRQALSRRH